MNENPDHVELHAIVSGTVQGVGFRATVRQYAKKFGLNGTVQNLPNGTVEIFAQGKKETLEKFIQEIHNHFGSIYIEELFTEYRASMHKYSDFTVIF